ncbi:glycosyltransferase family 4 protein [Aestuariispira insulae]|nr:glycosyltransferase family 4 protein [Aestuariispira insulae]
MPELVLFLTYGSSLKSWKDAGILERELALYHEHAQAGWKVRIVSYGGPEDLEIAKSFDFVEVLCNEYHLHFRLYAALIPWLHARVGRAATVLKTNQLYGAHIARRCARAWKIPLIVRQGYGHYEHRVAEYGTDSREALAACRYEFVNLQAGAHAVFTTAELAKRAADRHGLAPEKVTIVPNYIVPESWSPPFKAKRQPELLRLAFYGRFTEQKNLETFIEACAGMPVRLTLIGEGPLERVLKATAQKFDINCQFVGRVAQEKLREYLSDADWFVLPSHYEGHPKSLLETMSFGMPVFGADSPGIREQIVDGETGILADSSLVGLRHGLQRISGLDRKQSESLGKKARDWALSRFSVQAIAKMEQSLFGQVSQKAGRT